MAKDKWDAGFAVATGLFGVKAWFEAVDKEMAVFLTAVETDVALGTYTDMETGMVFGA